jgi:hypothetical protein
MRYDADRALQHPWITRDSTQQIPKMLNEQIALFDKQRKLGQIMNFVFFNSVIVHKQKPPNFTEYKKLLMM